MIVGFLILLSALAVWVCKAAPAPHRSRRQTREYREPTTMGKKSAAEAR